ncbi:MAG: sensor histidine kinase [Cyclobacteriaceae bacterium]
MRAKRVIQNNRAIFNIFKDIRKKYSAEFYQQILAINISRIRTITPLLLLLSFLFFIVIEIFKSSFTLSAKTISHLSLSVFFLLVIIFMKKVKTLSLIRMRTGYLFVYIYILMIMLHGTAIALFSYQNETSTYAYLVPTIAIMVGLYWPLWHLLIFIAFSSTTFLSFRLFIPEPVSGEIIGMFFFYLVLFFFITRSYYLVKVKEFENIKQLSIKTQLLKEKNKKIESARRELVSKNHELDNFVYRASHDLLGPISSLLGLHNVITMEIKEENALNYFNMFNNQATRMNQIILSLIEVTKIKETDLVLKPVDFRDIISNSYEKFSKFSSFYEIKFFVDIDLEETFISDPDIIQMTFDHLIDNSLKYKRKRVDSYVRINIYPNNHKGIIIQFSDNGLGISRSIQHRIFSMFFRGIESSKGSGLGLYTVKTGLEKLNGSIVYNSIENEGTTFTIELPHLDADIRQVMLKKEGKHI